MIHNLHKLGRAILIIFGVIALALAYWGIVRREAIISIEQNPRLILDEQRIHRGLILDRTGAVLAASLTDQESGLNLRRYPYPAAAPVVGYYSIRYGVGGIEAEYDEVLRGDSVLTPDEQVRRRILHRPQVGGDVRLTIDARIQQEAAKLLDGRTGAIVILSVPQGDVLAMASQPSFDANKLEANWDQLFDDPAAPLLNRGTQGRYQPGSILQSVVLGAALDSDITVPASSWGDDLAVSLNGGVLPCAGAPPPVDSLTSAYQWGCPVPFRLLGTALGARRLDSAIAGFGLLEAPVLPLPAEPLTTIEPPAEEDLQLTAIGQSGLTVTPLQMAQVAAAFANHGEIPALHLTQAVRAPDGEWELPPPEGSPRGTISRASAGTIARWMAQAVETGAARAARLPGRQVYGHTGLALAGPEGTLNAWFIGFVTHENGQVLAIAVLLEGENDASVAARIGGEALQIALDRLP